MSVDTPHTGDVSVPNKHRLQRTLTPGRLYVRDGGWPISPLVKKPEEALIVALAKSLGRGLRWVTRFATAYLEARRLQRIVSICADFNPVVDQGGDDASGRGLARCDIRYLNLDHRTDRRTEFEFEMRSLGVSRYARVPAVPASPGALGCGVSHIIALREWNKSSRRLLLVCEDDAAFTVPRAVLDDLVEEFAEKSSLRVLALAHRTAWHIPISDSLAVSSDIQTTAAYVVKPDFVDDVVEVFEASVRKLRSGEPIRRSAIDIVWKQIQRDNLFAIPRQTCVIQRSGYSDVQRKRVDYYREGKTA